MATTPWTNKILGWFTGQYQNILANCTGVEAVDISTADFYFTRPCKSIYVGTAGVVKAIMSDGSIFSVTTTVNNDYIDRGIFAGVQRADTTASGIVGLLQ